MPLWKQRQFSRLMKPIDGEGSDLGGGASATESAIDAVGVSDTPAETPEAPADTSADAQPGEATDTSTTTDAVANISFWISLVALSSAVAP